ncbi:cytochrome-c peroxidase [Owenweeksia hongkongensis]|uniref:cytochrome-c peroxidase n=1 Tax=Owenweeksia hongkongensis TaxID=253245 RepID=UPI0006941914|nr:cytochrome c peroxidase [Owenweeksia hongkongensis]
MLGSRKISLITKGRLLWVVGVLFLISSCRPDKTELQPVSFVGFERPGHFPAPHYNFKNNPVTKDGFELGRKLFYDPILSASGSISCGSCHLPEAGFADPGKAKSEGIDGLLGKRNSPALANLAWFPSFMADGGINHIEVMPIAPITDSAEMGSSLAKTMLTLNASPTYRKLFKQAFDVDSISDQKLLFALAQFMSMMISSESKFDEHLQGKNVFNESEKRGYKIFQQHCVSCHSGALTTDFSFKNNGLDITSADLGRARITQDENDRGKFKVPSLRNVELSYPYMHDGRFKTLDAVIDHYTTSIQPTPNLAEELQEPIILTNNEKQDLVKFLTTFTDYNYITKPSLAKSKQNL